MHILQVSYERSPKRVAPSGGDLGMFQNFSALKALGHRIDLVLVAPREPIDAEVRTIADGVHELRATETPLYLRPLRRVLNPETFALRFPSALGYDAGLARLAERLRPDVIWSDSTFALAASPRTAFPVVFGNYDFLYKLKAVRRATRPRLAWSDLARPRAALEKVRRPDAFTPAALERFELGLVREAAHVMCVSASEAGMLHDRGIAATHIPIVGPTIPRPAPAAPSGPLRLFLFGNHNTAHAAALREVRTLLHPALRALGAPVEWHQLGRPPQHPDEDWRWMEATFDRVHGFAPDLGAVFRPGDVSIVPYRHDTGFRTKFTVAAAYGVVSAGYLETFLCAPEFSRGVDCVAEPDATALAAALRDLAADPARRRATSAAARTLYDASYTFEAQLPRYAEILEAARATRARPR